MNISEMYIKLQEKVLYTAKIEFGKSCSFPNDTSPMLYNHSYTGNPYFSGFPSDYGVPSECYTARHFVGKIATTPNNLPFFIFTVGLKIPDDAAKSTQGMGAIAA